MSKQYDAPYLVARAGRTMTTKIYAANTYKEAVAILDQRMERNAYAVYTRVPNKPSWFTRWTLKKLDRLLKK